MANQNVYEQMGYKDRTSYLKSLAAEYGTDMLFVSSIAEVFGENEDFDGLISSLNDFFHLF